MSAQPKKILNVLYKVNLLIHKEQQPKIHIRLIRWLLASGRYIVIIVELITISAFVFRYKLDGDLEEQNSKIKQKIPYIQSLKNEEILVRETQFKLWTIRQTRSIDPNFVEVLTKIAQLTPKSIKLTAINLDRSQSFPKTSLIITGHTPTNLELSALLRALQKDQTFSDINLTNISFEEETTFTITGSLSGKGGSSS